MPTVVKNRVSLLEGRSGRVKMKQKTWQKVKQVNKTRNGPRPRPIARVRLSVWVRVQG